MQQSAGVRDGILRFYEFFEIGGLALVVYEITLVQRREFPSG